MDLKQLVEILAIEKAQAVGIARQLQGRVKQLEAELASRANGAAPVRAKPGRKPKVVDVSLAGQ